MTSMRFKIGDTVTARVAKPEVSAGARGAIVRATGSKHYIVQFTTAVALMRGYELAHVAPPSASQAHPYIREQSS